MRRTTRAEGSYDAYPAGDSYTFANNGSFKTKLNYFIFLPKVEKFALLLNIYSEQSQYNLL